MSRWRLGVALAITSGLLPALASPRETPRRGSLPPETAKVTLMLLDVEVTDKKGNPIRGLRKGDFTVHLDGRAWPIESVDDLCPCGEPGDPGLPPSAPPAAQLAGSSSVWMAEPAQFVLYMDFSQLQSDGRSRAIKEAKRWVADVMRADDRVMIAGYATAAGLRLLCPFTNDRTTLTATLDAAYSEPALNDPFPTLYSLREMECVRDPLTCRLHAADEYQHGRRSLETLQRFLQNLELVPGRKQLILFAQNGNIHPGDLYGVHTWDHVNRLEDVVAEATTSQVTLHPMTLFDTLAIDPLSSDTKEFGFDLADATGGVYNRGPFDLSRILDDVRLRCACVYRIGLVPPVVESRKIHRVRVNVRGRTLPHDYITQSLTEMDRWLRRARAVLGNPESARDLRVTAGLLPMRADSGMWELRAQVALDLGSLTMLPAAARSQGRWEVGAALARTDGGESWEMLGFSEVNRAGSRGSEVWAVSERRFRNLMPGRYRMVAFVRDRSANVFGGAESSITLPRPGRDGVAGPVLMRSSRRQVVSTLPLLKERDKQQSTASASVVAGPIPYGDTPADPDEPLEVMTWVCGRQGGTSSLPLWRYISEGGRPVLRFEEGQPEPAGQCLRITDRIEGWSPRPGSYSYTLRRTVKGELEADGAEVSFEVGGPYAATTAR